jgi:RPA family protein
MSQNYAERQPAKRLFAAELNEAYYHFKETDEDRAPNYLLLPRGEKANRVMMGGTLMSVEDVSNEGNDPFWKAVIQDGTGEFRAFAGKYSPEEAASVLQGVKQDESMPPAYVIVIGKTKEYRPEDDESEILINIQSETIAIVSEEQRNNFIKETAEHTINQLENETGEYVLQADERHGDRVSLLKNDVRESLGMLE